MPVNLNIPTLGNRFIDYRDDILGDSYNFGPVLNASQVKYFAFHHSVTPQTAKNDGNWKAECDRIASEHVNGNGWAGVGYRFIICSNGVVAYVGDLSHGGAAVRNHNDVIISACMVGDFTQQLPTDIQINSAHDLAQWFISNMPQYPLINSWDQVIGHKDAAVIWNEPAFATACPGTSWAGINAPSNEMKWRIQTNTVYTPGPHISPSASASRSASRSISPSASPSPSPAPVITCEDKLSQLRQIVGPLGYFWSKSSKDQIKKVLGLA